MAKFKITMEVEDVEVFGMLAKNRALQTTLGNRLVELVLAPGAAGILDRVGLSIYGIDNIQVERLNQATAGSGESKPHCAHHPDRLAVTDLDGDHLCQDCANDWVRAEGAHQEYLAREEGRGSGE
jgi:hypothetical protein